MFNVLATFWEGTEVPVMESLCSAALQPRLADRPHHYQASSDRGTDRYRQGSAGKSSVWDQLGVDAGAQLSTYAIQMQRLVCCDRALPDQVHLYLFRLSVEEVVSDSRWGCGPIRAGLLEDDEWGRLREPGRNTGRGRLKMPTAVSLNEYKHAEGLLHTE